MEDYKDERLIPSNKTCNYKQFSLLRFGPEYTSMTQVWLIIYSEKNQVALNSGFYIFYIEFTSDQQDTIYYMVWFKYEHIWKY